MESITKVIPLDKKEWITPNIECLDINQTKNGDFNADTEGSWWIFTWGS